jgi:hypothetical protein
MYWHGRSAVFFDLDRSRPRLYPRAFVGLRSLTDVVFQSLNLRRSTVGISFPSWVHGPVSIHLFPFPPSPILSRFLSISSHFLSFTSPKACLFHRFPLPPSFIGPYVLCRSSVPSLSTVCVCVYVWCVNMCVYGGAAYADLVNQLQCAAISDVVSLLLPPTWVAQLHARASWVTIVHWPVI